MTDSDLPEALNPVLTQEQSVRVRDLMGFRKGSHQVPSEAHAHADAFVQRIAADDLNQELDQRFDEFRNHLQLKRRELTVNEPQQGEASLVTPWFRFEIRYRQSPDFPDTALVQRRLEEWNPDQSPAEARMDSAFGTLFDTVELTFPQPVNIEDLIDDLEDQASPDVHLNYPRDASWCTITLAENAAVSEIYTDVIRIRMPQGCRVRDLLNACVATTKRLPALPFA